MEGTEGFDLQRTSAGGAERIAVSGELDAYTAPQLRKLIDEVLDTTSTDVVVDLSATTFIDSTGLGVLVGASRKAKSRDNEVFIDSPSRSVHRVLQITGLTLTIPIRNAPEGDEDEAIPGTTAGTSA